MAIRFVEGTAVPVTRPCLLPGDDPGSFPNWTINFEDGDNAGQPGEPDFADVVFRVEAVPHP